MPGDQTHIDPAKLLEHLNREVYGQKFAKEKLTDALAWNQERLRLIRSGVPASDLPAKANVLLIGPTGCGKTFLTSTAAKFCGLPYFCTQADKYSAPGYKGLNLDSMIDGLVRAAGGSAFAAEGGIIFIDEIDKIRQRNFGGEDDVGGLSIQQGLLTILEGSVIQSEFNSVDTSGITFVAGGAFTSISDRIGPEGKRQFGAAELRNCGFIPEFIGRFSVRVGLAPLAVEDLRKLLLECQSSTLWQTRNLFKMQGIEFVVEDKVIDSIIETAKRMGTGARSLDETLKDRCLGLMSRISDLPRRGVTRVIIREDGVTEEKSPSARRSPVPPAVLPPPRTQEPPPSPHPAPPKDLPPPSPRSRPPEEPVIPTALPPVGEVPGEDTRMPVKGWMTLALAILLLAFGIGALSSSPSRVGASGPLGAESERVVGGEKTPRLWHDVRKGQIPK